MKTSTFCRTHYASPKDYGRALLVSEDMADVWERAVHGVHYKWALWIMSRPGVLSNPQARMLMCNMIRTVRMPYGLVASDLVSVQDIETLDVMEAHSRGEVSDEHRRAAGQAAGARLKALEEAYKVQNAPKASCVDAELQSECVDRYKNLSMSHVLAAKCVVIAASWMPAYELATHIEMLAGYLCSIVRECYGESTNYDVDTDHDAQQRARLRECLNVARADILECIRACGNPFKKGVQE